MTYRTIQDVTVGDKVMLYRSMAKFYPNLQTDTVYTIAEIHPLPVRYGNISSSGTVTLAEASNPSPSRAHHPGSYGFAAFKKVEEPPLSKFSTGVLLDELHSRGWSGTLTRTTTEKLSV